MAPASLASRWAALVMGDVGGMVTTNRADLWNAMWVLKDQGKIQEEV